MEHILPPPINNNHNHRRNRDTEHTSSSSTSSCKRIKFDDVIFRPVVKESDLKVECVSDDVSSEICFKTESTESSNSKKTNNNKNKNNSPSNEATSRRQLSAPSAEELDEFFKKAEKHQQKRFIKKYNFDIVKDVPIEGRYEWVKLNQ